MPSYTLTPEPPTDCHHIRDWRYWKRAVLGGVVFVVILTAISTPMAIAKHSALYLLRPALALFLLIVIALFQLRNGTVIEPRRLSIIAAFKRHDLSWGSITRIDVERSWRQWIIRTWQGPNPSRCTSCIPRPGSAVSVAATPARPSPPTNVRRRTPQRK
ncbi:MAG TPA: hypothetical protein VE172_15150 [Stackebrandtia sp.]|uniref:hypothetical protein n=1 Tax=Stackebrandtia sp. TaxID=2023065 RepID=UPI002D6BFBB5|nr:hypothetical protein [Stackebrandtia sp.]HZE40143.1 hypothetical protein [Stackebrandtia sp.]